MRITFATQPRDRSCLDALVEIAVAERPNDNGRAIMKKRYWLGTAVAIATLSTSAWASGSIKAGGSISPRDAYMQGKSLTFNKLVCNGCPIAQGDMNRSRAMSVKASLEARDEATKPGTPDDQHIQVLDRTEQEMVHYYLTRRYKLGE